MNIAAVSTTALFVIIAIIKFYYMFKTISEKGIKEFFKDSFKKKLIAFTIITVIFGIYILFNPDFQFENPKDMIGEYVTLLIN
jgi:hypothetical protein